MTDVVVVVPLRAWDEWLTEGDLAGEPASGQEYAYTLGNHRPNIAPGERVYIVAGRKLRGWAPLIAVAPIPRDRFNRSTRYALVRGGGAVACTIDEEIWPFRGYRYRWWDRATEQEFPTWQEL